MKSPARSKSACEAFRQNKFRDGRFPLPGAAGTDSNLRFAGVLSIKQRLLRRLPRATVIITIAFAQEISFRFQIENRFRQPAALF